MSSRRHSRAGKKRKSPAKAATAKVKPATMKGGAPNYRGTNFQVEYAVMRTYELLTRMVRSPEFNRQFGIEVRTEPKGQAWDFLEAGVKHTEAKINPGKKDVTEWLQRLVERDADRRYELVCQIETGPVSDLRTLVRDARSCTTEEDFRTRTTSRARDYLDILGARAYELLKLIDIEAYPPSAIERDLEKLALDLVPANKREALFNSVAEHLRRRGAEQQPWTAWEMLGELKKEGIDVHQYPEPSYEALPSIIRPALRVMQICGAVGVPEVALAAACVTSEAQLRSALCSVPIVTEDVQHWRLVGSWDVFREKGSPSELVRALDKLIALIPAAIGSSRLTSYIRAVEELSVALIHDEPARVMTVFVELDHNLKTLGNKRHVAEIAHRSLDAAKRVRPATDAELQGVRDVTARTLVCGVSWVNQRTGAFREADAAAETALRNSPSAVTTAFSWKCRGRLRRLFAEREQDSAKRAAYLDESIAFLKTALTGFEALTDFSRRSYEIGDCRSLLARTLLVRGDVSDAREQLQLANNMLSSFPDTKGYLDATLLHGDISRAEKRLDIARASYEAVIGSHIGAGVENNEIVARAHVAMYQLQYDSGEKQASRESLERAIAIYDRLEETERAAALKVVLLGDQLPRELRSLVPEYEAHRVLDAYANPPVEVGAAGLRADLRNITRDAWRKHIENRAAMRPAGEADWRQ